nr:ribonuclease H-like domain-containing protein [Tanacetum cinerariifolium]
MRFESLSSWDLDNCTWGGRVEVCSTVPLCVCAQELAGERVVCLGGKSSPSGDFEIFTLLVPGLWLLSFEGLGFDLLAKLIQVSHGLGPQKTLSFLFDVQGNPQQALKDKGVIDSGCSRHMTGNISYLSNFEEINGGYVAFGENPKGGKITGKGKIRTGKLDFHDVYFVKELKFHLFSVSQMCDKKNSVLFIDTECVVLSSDFKLPDENHVLLRVPIEKNIYNVDLKNIVPSGDLTCLFAKATLDESNIWHRRLGHINFKTMNKLVKCNLVRGLPSKVFENNHTYVACKKGKQHRASWNQPNHNAGIQENLDADTVGKDTESTQQYVLLPLWSTGSKVP